ncbi:MAG: polysulfide reductase NrfD [Proteobacteria bacterium]|nr:polysulfide reductase NrfD [Pseudomonadota bacterium]
MSGELYWGLPVIGYLFLAGVGAGAVTVSSYVLLRGGGGRFAGAHFSLARYGALLGPFPVMLGTGMIIFELGRWDRALNLFKLINLSPMSIGSWLLLLFMTITVLYGATFLPPGAHRGDRLEGARRGLAWVCMPLGIGVAVYTGVMLGAMPSRPFWNSPILALLFLVSSLSTGIATIILGRALVHRKGADRAAEKQFHESGYLLTVSDVMLIGLELMVIFLFLMFAHLTVGGVKEAVSIILPGGRMAAMFWIWVVLVGLLLPALLEMVYVVPPLFYHRSFAAPRSVEVVVPVSVLIGGFMLRYVVVVAGQITGPVGI